MEIVKSYSKRVFNKKDYINNLLPIMGVSCLLFAVVSFFVGTIWSLVVDKLIVLQPCLIGLGLTLITNVIFTLLVVVEEKEFMASELVKSKKIEIIEQNNIFFLAIKVRRNAFIKIDDKKYKTVDEAIDAGIEKQKQIKGEKYVHIGSI